MGIRFSMRAAVVVALITLAGCGGSSPVAEPPPPLERAPFSLWLSASRVSDDAELVAVLRDHSGPDATFGVGAVSLQPSPTNQMGRSAALPELAEGDYRLVRAGPNGAHTGRFWVTGAAA